jgi:hypothetical protein
MYQNTEGVGECESHHSHADQLFNKLSARMQTAFLRTIKQPSFLTVLLRDLVETFNVVPTDAYEVRDRASLPPALQRFVRSAAHLEASWACWMDDAGHAWFYFAEMPLELSRQHGKPVLQIDRYEEDGSLLETSKWVEASDGKWSRVPSS